MRESIEVDGASSTLRVYGGAIASSILCVYGGAISRKQLSNSMSSVGEPTLKGTFPGQHALVL